MPAPSARAGLGPCSTAGRALGWYPYPFLNPASVGGYGVAVHAVGIAVTFIFAGWILLAAANGLGAAAAAVPNAGVS